jgi:NADH dehydrogenase FAD-containing subunit
MNPSRQLLRMSGIRRLSSSAAGYAARGQKQLYDVVVVGGGIVGMTFAAEVARKVKGLKIAVLDTKVRAHQSEPRFRSGA